MSEQINRRILDCRICRNQKRKENRQKNIERSREVVRNSYAKHREKRQEEAREKYQQNPESYKQRATEWNKAHPDKRSLIMSQQNSIRRARMYENGYETITIQQWTEICNKSKNRCIYCRAKTQLVIDHFQPISKGGGHLIANIVPACKICNSSKWNREPEEWIVEKFGRRKLAYIKKFLAL